jgi:hypothetical protein
MNYPIDAELLRDYIRKLVALRKKSASLSNYQWRELDGTWGQQNVGCACFAWMDRNSGCSGYVTSVLKPQAPARGRKFFDWILDPEKSPWRKITNHLFYPYRDCEIEVDGEVYKPFSVDFMYNQGFIIWDSNLSNNSVVNFLMGARFIFEKQEGLKVWDELTEHGYDPVISYFVGEHTALSVEGKYRIGWLQSNHQPFDPSYDYIGLYYDAFKASDINTEGPHPMSKKMSYRPCNASWGKPVNKYNVPTFARRGDGWGAQYFSKEDFYKRMDEIHAGVGQGELIPMLKPRRPARVKKAEAIAIVENEDV